MDIQRVTSALSAGDIIAFPTETVYGLACDASNANAIAALYALKGRDEGKPMQIMVSSINQAVDIAVFNSDASALAEAFLPGPLTLVVNQKDGTSVHPTAARGMNTVGVRIPNHPVAYDILKAYGKPIAATSANKAGEPPALSYEEVLAIFPELECVVPGKVTDSIPSTVLDATKSPPSIIREGSISAGMIAEILA